MRVRREALEVVLHVLVQHLVLRQQVGEPAQLRRWSAARP